MKRKVVCAVCEKKDTVDISKDSKIIGDWKYFGKININCYKTERFLYRVVKVPGKKFNMLDKEQLVRERNPSYDPKVEPNFVEYWECSTCFNKSEKK